MFDMKACISHFLYFEKELNFLTQLRIIYSAKGAHILLKYLKKKYLKAMIWNIRHYKLKGYIAHAPEKTIIKNLNY